MAFDTDIKLRNMIIYEVYVRNHSKAGNFNEVRNDLDRIKALGTDIVWLMPIQPIGEKNKKGSLGCPYAIRDYRKINPEYGTMEDFKELIKDIHSHDMKAMIDIVFNHTSPDSELRMQHPDYFYKKPDGSFGNKAADWYDVIDLDYNNANLWLEQIDVLKFWASLGIDGFRCDVAPLVPLKFWMAAREEIKKINKDMIWLSESIDPECLLGLRKMGFGALSDSEIYNAFDIAYDYDVYNHYKNYINGTGTLKEYVDKLREQEYIYPDNYVKLRFLENHDTERAKKLIPDEGLFKIWTAFKYFEKGCTLIYGGEEAQDINRPSLFDIDRVNWNGLSDEFTDYIKKLALIKRQEIFAKGWYNICPITDKDAIYATYEYEGKKTIGIFNVGKEEGILNTDIDDGSYINEIDGSTIQISAGKLKLTSKPMIFNA